MISKTDKNFSVSVIIPAYNSEMYIRRAVDSVLKQTFPADEIIIVDDGSTDRTAEIIKAYGNKVIYLYQEHSGANAARNRGIMMSKGTWVAFLDSDDEWLPCNLESHFQVLGRLPDIVWAYGNYEVVNINTKEKYLCHKVPDIASVLKNGMYFDNFLDAYASKINMTTITLIVKRGPLIEAGMFLPGQITNHDPDLAMRICYRHPAVGYTKEPLAVNYFGRIESITQRCKLHIEERCDFIQRHLELSSRYGYKGKFEKVASMLLKKWTREFLAENAQAELLPMMRQFPDLLPIGLKCEVRLMNLSPKYGLKIVKFYFEFKYFFRRLCKKKFCSEPKN